MYGRYCGSGVGSMRGEANVVFGIALLRRYWVSDRQ